MYHLAPHPEWQKEMREEVEEVVRAHGWSKAAMGKMRKLDSFLREQQRYDGLGIRELSYLRYSNDIQPNRRLQSRCHDMLCGHLPSQTECASLRVPS